MCLMPSTTAATAAICKSPSNGKVIEAKLAPIVKPATSFATTGSIEIVTADAPAVAAKVKSPPSKLG